MRPEDPSRPPPDKDQPSPSSSDARTPVIQLPKGGGAIRGIGEKFAANPTTGTGSMSVPIATSPGRSGFGPQLSLSYDSGAGNGPFGFGWSLSLPSITRKTDKGIPQYFDAQHSDVFILSGAEDLVPVYRQDADGSWVAGHPGYQRDPAGLWVRDPAGRLVVHEDELDGYRVRRYRPRIEGLFARIDRWSKIDSPGDVHWRSISKDNILTLYGLDANSRIADPLDVGRIFTWLICETRDDKGNAVLYRYKAEDGLRVDLGKAHDRNRGPRNDPRRTANRYLKRIHYGNRTPLLDNAGYRPRFLDLTQINSQIANAGWMFEVLFDYGDHDTDAPKPNDDLAKDAGGLVKYPWNLRPDPFSSYRSGFEVRTTRLCQRILMFHHFPGEAGVERDCLVRSTDFTYSDELDPTDVRNPVYTFLQAVTQTGYRRKDGGYDKRSLPPVEFRYSQPIVQDRVEEVDPQSLENLPIGVDGSAYRWTDLHGEGIPGILTEQAGAWFYKRNLSPLPIKLLNGDEQVRATFAPLEAVALKPNAALSDGAEIMDLAGDGQPDVVLMGGLTPGLYEHDEAEGWQPFRPFLSRLNRDLRDPNLKFVDLDGDGHSDLLITEDDAFVWHPSLAEEGFGPARRVAQALDEEKGPRIVFADGIQSIHLADLSGDGLTDIVRIRNGEVCYWPNLGYGRFGAKVTMDNAPWFDHPDQFDEKRIRLADIDGSGTTDIIYLHRDGVRLYFNQSGNSWSQPVLLKVFPRVDDLVSVVPTDLLGNGTACLVWSSPLPGDTRRPMRYVNLMGAGKPHLLVQTINNLGAETRVNYVPSTQHYLQDKRDGKPWITRLPFPVHVVERVETYDRISRNRFLTRYAYHHGFFDGEEREFRGFGMVEQWDTEQLAALAGADLPADNLDPESNVPPVRTRTWFHTGVYLGRGQISRQFEQEYFREPGLTVETARPLLLDDTVLPTGLTLEEEREACRALKGSMLRQETYADDAYRPGATLAQVERSRTPYTVTEQNFTIRAVQPRGGNRHSVFFSHARELISYQYERNAADPRVQHALTLEVDRFGNVLKQAAVGYGRREQIRVVDARGQVPIVANPGLTRLDTADQSRQTTALLTYTENRVTNAIDLGDTHRNPLPCESLTYELTGYPPTGSATAPANGVRRFQAADFVEPDPDRLGRLRHKFTAPEVPYEGVATGARRRRPIEWLRTLYRRDDFSDLMPLEQLQPLALPGESYKLAFTPGLLAQIFQRPRQGQPAEPLLPNPGAVLSGQAGDRGGYLQSRTLKGDGRFPASDPDEHWWVPSGRSFYTANPADTAVTELAEARRHFFVPHRYRDPFGQDAFVEFDDSELMIVETRDALGNRVTVEANDYRVLQPRLISDPNQNRTEVAFDVLGMVVGTAVMGKPAPAPVEGDTLTGFVTELTPAQLATFTASPRQPSANPKASEATAIVHDLLRGATTLIVYDLDRFMRQGEPSFAATVARETHVSDLRLNQRSRLQVSFSFFDGSGRDIQKKIQAEPGPVVEGGPPVSPRWVGSGWTIFNNKGNPVRRYQPFFSDTHRFEFGLAAGVSPVLFYDPAERVIATLHPNHTYEKVAFDAWQQATYDVNDTCAARNTETGDPRTDGDIGGYVAEYFTNQPATWQTWYSQRTAANALGADEHAAAQRAAGHADTPTVVHFDALGRPYLTVARNRVVCSGHALDGQPDEDVRIRVELDIEGNQRVVRDERQLPVNFLPAGPLEQRIVMRYDYDMLGTLIRQHSMEAGMRWMLDDVAGKPIRAWDSRGHNVETRYDELRRPVEQYVRGTTAGSDPRTLNRDVLVERIEYGEPPPNPTPAEETLAQRLNLRTRIYRDFDSAGVAINALIDANGNPTEAYDFKGNLLRGTRRLATDYKAIADWSTNPGPQLDAAERIESRTRYDALNRPIQSIAPHSSLARAKRHVIQPTFNEAHLLERVDVWLQRANEPTALIDPDTEAPSPVGVANIDHDALGRRLRIDYRNGATTRYTYDRDTLRLIGLDTEDTAALQLLRYTYDPVGNIIHIRDAAQQTLYFRNRRVDPDNDYTYDALYRLAQAKGREHLGQHSAPIPHSYNDASRVGILSANPPGRFAPNDPGAMGTYIERYVYDAVGNFLQMQHERGDAAVSGWTRRYDYSEASLIEPAKWSNRLSRTRVGTSPSDIYSHDAHGNLLQMPQLQVMQWDYKDQLQITQRQRVNNSDVDGVAHEGERTYYVYDASGQRVRKVTELSPNHVKGERVYVGGFEIFRDHGGATAPISGNTARRERETLHVMDDDRRVALVEMRTVDEVGTDQAPPQLIRYQLGNHVGSACLELDEQAEIISFEEYSPYGGSTYQAVRSRTETPKRFRYTGKERDEESGLNYHGARYYAEWLARWTRSDPIDVADGLNTYAYASGNPVRWNDPTGTIGEAEQMHLIEQTSLRQPVTATNATRGYGEWLRHAFQGLGSQWMRGPIDVGDPEDLPFAITPPGTTRDLFAQPRKENQEIGRNIIKPLVQGAREAGVTLREHDAWPGGTPGQVFGQPGHSPHLEGLHEVRHQMPLPLTYREPEKAPIGPVPQLQLPLKVAAPPLPAHTGKPIEAPQLPSQTVKPIEAPQLPSQTIKPIEAPQLPSQTIKPIEAPQLPSQTIKPIEAPQFPTTVAASPADTGADQAPSSSSTPSPSRTESIAKALGVSVGVVVGLLVVSRIIRLAPPLWPLQLSPI